MRWLRRLLGRILIGILTSAALVYIGDYVVFLLRGKPQDSVTVTRYLAAPLKNHKTEYYFEGTAPTPCARALFPQAGASPCWYLRRHPIYAENL